MQQAKQNLGGRLGEGSVKKTRGEGQASVSQEDAETEKDEEVTSHGAAGTLTGAEDRAC